MVVYSLGVLTHAQKVKSLYKRSLRAIEERVVLRYAYRYQAVLLRQDFERDRCISDENRAKELLRRGEEFLFQNSHPCKRQFWNSPGGSAYQREVIPPDWIVDYWHPLEKAQYPDYFQRREIRKKEYVKFWLSMFPNSGPSNGDLLFGENKNGDDCKEPK